MKRAVTMAMLAMACGPGSDLASGPRAQQLPGERNDALFSAAQASGVPAEVLMVAAWRQTRFELAEREEVLAPTPEVVLADDALDTEVPLADEPEAGAPLPSNEEGVAEPGVQDQPESLGLEPEQSPRFGLFALATEPVTLRADAADTAARLAAAASALQLRPGERSFAAWAPVLIEVLVPDADADVQRELYREFQDAWDDGFDLTTADGERVVLTGAGRELAAVEQELRAGAYPPVTVIPASSRNYGSRQGGRVRFVVVHDIEGYQAGAISVFKNPANQVSAHYIVRASDGRIVKMVNESQAAWHAGHSWFNHNSIGIEHEGFANRPRGGGLYTTRQYQASANLVCAIAKKYRIPVDRQHIFGHGNVPANLSSHTLCSDASANAGRCGGYGHHHDPGRYWAWSDYMARIRRCVAAAK